MNQKLHLPQVTLIGIDCIDIERLRLAAEICELGCSFGAVKMLSSIKFADPRVIPIKPIRSTKEYSKFVIKRLNEYIDTEYALVFQHDGFILNAKAWTDEFLKYDYIGAPWYHLEDIQIGNGGFSLRSKKLLDFIAKNHQSIGGPLDPEDVWIARNARPFLEQVGMKFATVPVAKKFCKEGGYAGVMWNGEFGFHSAGYTNISNWYKKNPGYKKRLKFKLAPVTRLLGKHPNDSVRILSFKAPGMKSYVNLAAGKRNYEARMVSFETEGIREGQIVVFKRSGISFEKVPVRAFERKITGIEKFNTLEGLREKYPNMHVTFPVTHRHDANPKAIWLQKLQSYFGDYFYPKDRPYVVFWF